MYGVALRFRVGHQIEGDGAALELEGVRLADVVGPDPAQSQKRTCFFEFGDEIAHQLERIALRVEIHKTYGECQFDFSDVHDDWFFMGGKNDCRLYVS